MYFKPGGLREIQCGKNTDVVAASLNNVDVAGALMKLSGCTLASVKCS